MTEDAALVRPRTTGELLDDAWRLYFADAPILLLFSGVFLAPAFGGAALWRPLFRFLRIPCCACWCRSCLSSCSS